MVKPAALIPALRVLCWAFICSLIFPDSSGAQPPAVTSERFAGAWHTEYRDADRGTVRGIAAIAVTRESGNKLAVTANYQESTAQGFVNRYPVYATIDGAALTVSVGSDVVISLGPSEDRGTLSGRWVDRDGRARKGKRTEQGWQIGDEIWKRAIPSVTAAVITIDGQRLNVKMLATGWQAVAGLQATMRLEGDGLPLRYPPSAQRRVEYLQVAFKDPLLKEGSFAFGKAASGDGWVEFPVYLFRGLKSGRKTMLLNGTAITFDLSLGEEAPAVSSPGLRVRWRPAEPDTDGWQLESATTGRMEVVPVRYRRDGAAVLELTLPRSAPAPTAVRVMLIDALGGQSAELVGPVTARFDTQGVATIPLPMERLLKTVSTQVNRNALHADVRVVLGGQTVVSRTERALHLVRQKVILFVPGVCGSRIKVAGHPREEAFPEFAYVTPEFGWLRSYPSGWPESVAVELKLFEKFQLTPGAREAESLGVDVYTMATVRALQRPPDHPVLSHTSPYLPGERPAVSSTPTPVPYQPRYTRPYYIVQPWPYDWRLRLEHAVDLLQGRVPRGDNDPAFPPYEIPPSIARVIQAAKASNPFLDDKIAIASHSTGGLITRGALMEPGIESLVDQAFFINVPFWGAPKAYFVYLTGDMGLPFIQSTFMRNVAPNTPVVYYLAPTERYRGEVARFFNTQTTRQEAAVRRPGQEVSQFMDLLISEARRSGLYPAAGSIDPWNRGLEADARAFHTKLQGEPRIRFANSWVFWSVTSDIDTHGAVKIQRRLVSASKAPQPLLEISYDRVRGDGTVPVVSQQADFPREQLIAIPGKPDHVAASNQEFVWERIVEILGRLP